MGRKIRKVQLEIDDRRVKRSMDKYCEEARKLGASDSKVVTTDKIPVDERVQLKCIVPKCFGYGTSANCPPHTIKAFELRELVKKYRYGICVKLEVPPQVIVRNRDTILERAGAYKKIFEIVSAVESMAFYDGYYLAVGFAAGSCKSTFCFKTDCAVLKGERCRNELKVRPSMEAVGIDAYRLSAHLGWEMYPIGSDCDPNDIPGGVLMGLILIN